ncbi:hypothetical protein F2Q69_00054936 [Brassica cretica]|uniref:Uncharacterized protein n=1 Tax=Brassica cretica TaxID=69181 RepID=A0A8S9MNV4_BRACR|nr:hypothetical protein F2Q69_00054936 [Brassica cretica]
MMMYDEEAEAVKMIGEIDWKKEDRRFSYGGMKIRLRTDISLRRSAVVASAITGASETVKVSDLRGNEIPISDLWKDRKAVVAFARHFGC